MRAKLIPVASFIVVSACTAAPFDESSLEQESCSSTAAAAAPKSKLHLTEPSSTIAQTSSQTWSLTKTGAVDTTSSTVTWNIVASQTPTVEQQLAITGTVSVKNTGHAPATIGNVVVRLETRPANKWNHVVSNVADATSGDAATSVSTVANKQAQTVTEGAGAGSIAFRESGTPFSLVPQISVPPGADIDIDVIAAFDNAVLALPVGSKVRAVVTVTFGNAGPGNSATDVDINGNGTIDADEARVDSVRATFDTEFVPAATPIGNQVTLTDTAGDISTTGTVTFTNPVFNLSSTTGTVTVTYAGGTDGGTITNCAHLSGDADLEACDTQAIAADAFQWNDGDVITHTQGNWGGTPSGTNAAAVLQNNYGAVYASPAGILELGIPGAAGFSIVFTNSGAVLGYLPASGAPTSLTDDHLNPTTTEAGAFGGEVLALRLNVDFSDAGVTLGTRGVAFGNLTLCNFPTTPGIEGMTVRQFLTQVESLLGGGAAVHSIAELFLITSDVNASFEGAVTSFADDHLVIGTCP